MRQFKFITNRTIANKNGEEKGKVRAMVKSDSNRLEGNYVCSECLHEGNINQEFKRPLSVRCESCKFLMKLPKLKGKKK